VPKRAAALIICLAGAMLLAVAAVAQEAVHLERADQLRAGYLLNFIKFVEWPGGAAEHRTICFVGGAGIRDAIVAAQAARQSGTTAVVVRMLANGEGFAGCQILYVDSVSGLDPAFNVAGQSLLTVGETQDFTGRGGVIELYPEGNRLRFNINLANARRAGLKISSSLLQLASHVEESGR
jgi:YfiR/HmsC-like